MPKKGEAHSKRPAQIRARLRRGNARVEDYFEELGLKPIDEWSFKELAKGKPDGHKGKAPWLKPAVRDEVMRRLQTGFFDEIREVLPDAIKVMKDFLTDEENPKLRFDAAKLLLEYMVGAPEKRVAIRGASQVETMLADVISLGNGEEMYTGRILEGEFQEDEDDDLPSER